MCGGYRIRQLLMGLRFLLVSLLTSLDREASECSYPTANGLLKFMKKYHFIASLSLMADVLPNLARLSQTLQSSSLDFSILDPVVRTCIALSINFVTLANILLN